MYEYTVAIPKKLIVTQRENVIIYILYDTKLNSFKIEKYIVYLYYY
jgi:hypothetical protein